MTTRGTDASIRDGAARIVAGIDGSASSLKALHWAAKQAALTETSLEVIMTWEWPPSYGWSMPFPTDYVPDESCERELEESILNLKLEFPDVEVTGRVVHGHPAPSLVEASKGAALLVVGSRGHGEFAGMLLGSVSEYCVTHAQCPVMVNREPD